MKREWKPGDVAAFQAPHVRSPLVIFRYRDHRSGRDEWMTADEGGAYPSDSASLRPLLVIDPDDREQVGRLADALYGIPTLLQVARVHDALRSLLAPPKPPEPMGLGAVVEASAYSNRVRLFVRCPGTVPWVDVDGDGHEWSALDVVRVLSEGWVEES